MRDDIELAKIRETHATHFARDQPRRERLRFRAAQHEARHRRADEWFEYACECEAANNLDEAAAAYRRAIAVDPHHAEAHFNLGNVLRERGSLNEAERHFRIAANLNNQFSHAWYNLADVLDERGELAEAIACLRRVLALDPLYADAHFNVARCYEAAGDFTVAAHHWTRYLMLDPHSDWAIEARAALVRCHLMSDVRAHAQPKTAAVTSPSHIALQPLAT